MEPEERGGLGVGTIIMLVASVMFIFYILHKISKQREELRGTINLLTDEDIGFVDGLESMVKKGVLKPIPASTR